MSQGALELAPHSGTPEAFRRPSTDTAGALTPYEQADASPAEQMAAKRPLKLHTLIDRQDPLQVGQAPGMVPLTKSIGTETLRTFLPKQQTDSMGIHDPRVNYSGRLMDIDFNNMASELGGPSPAKDKKLVIFDQAYMPGSVGWVIEARQAAMNGDFHPSALLAGVDPFDVAGRSRDMYYVWEESDAHNDWMLRSIFASTEPSPTDAHFGIPDLGEDEPLEVATDLLTEFLDYQSYDSSKEQDALIKEFTAKGCTRFLGYIAGMNKLVNNLDGYNPRKDRSLDSATRGRLIEAQAHLAGANDAEPVMNKPSIDIGYTAMRTARLLEEMKDYARYTHGFDKKTGGKSIGHMQRRLAQGIISSNQYSRDYVKMYVDVQDELEERLGREHGYYGYRQLGLDPLQFDVMLIDDIDRDIAKKAMQVAREHKGTDRVRNMASLMTGIDQRMMSPLENQHLRVFVKGGQSTTLMQYADTSPHNRTGREMPYIASNQGESIPAGAFGHHPEDIAHSVLEPFGKDSASHARFPTAGGMAMNGFVAVFDARDNRTQQTKRFAITAGSEQPHILNQRIQQTYYSQDRTPADLQALLHDGSAGMHAMLTGERTQLWHTVDLTGGKIKPQGNSLTNGDALAVVIDETGAARPIPGKVRGEKPFLKRTIYGGKRQKRDGKEVPEATYPIAECERELEVVFAKGQVFAHDGPDPRVDATVNDFPGTGRGR